MLNNTAKLTVPIQLFYNWTAGTVDPGSITVNWKIIR